MRSTWGPNWRSGREALRSAQVASDTSSTMATASVWWDLARSMSPLRAGGWTLVASTTHSRPASSRLPATKCSTSKAALVAAWSFSSSDTSPRKKSEDRTSVGRKWLAANVDLPDPVTPTRATTQSSGILMVVIG